MAVALICFQAHGEASMSQVDLQKYYLQCREEKNRLWNNKQYSEAVQLFEKLRTTPGIEKLEEDDHVNIIYNLACGYAQLGQKDKALYYLKTAVDTGLISTDILAKDSDLDPVREDAKFKEILASEMAREKLWNGTTLSTPFKANISENEKIAGLSKFWAEVKYNFAYFDHVPEVDWDALYMQYLPKVRKTKSTIEYYRVLQELCARLRDGHTCVYLPQGYYNSPAVRTRLVENIVLITDVYDDSLAKDGIIPGLEITHIDGIPVCRYADQRVRPYQSASTVQGLDVATYTFQLLNGLKDRQVRVTLRDEKGHTFERNLPRNNVRKPLSTVEFKMLDGNIAYLALNQMEVDSVSVKFTELYPYIEKADALVIDVSRNPGGNSAAGWDVLGYLTDKPFRVHRVRTLKYEAYSHANGGIPTWVDLNPNGERMSKEGIRVFTKPVVVLTSSFTGSAAEDFCVAFAAMKRGKIIGEPTFGSTGQPLCFPLPGGGSARVCTCRTTFPDGTEFMKTGIQPDIVVHSTVSDIRAGRSTVLQAALDYLRGQLRPSPAP